MVVLVGEALEAPFLVLEGAVARELRPRQRAAPAVDVDVGALLQPPDPVLDGDPLRRAHDPDAALFPSGDVLRRCSIGAYFVARLGLLELEPALGRQLGPPVRVALREPPLHLVDVRLVERLGVVQLVEDVQVAHLPVVRDAQEHEGVLHVPPVDAVLDPLEPVDRLLAALEVLDIREHPARELAALAEVLVAVCLLVRRLELKGVGDERLAKPLGGDLVVVDADRVGVGVLDGLAPVLVAPVLLVRVRVPHSERPEVGRSAALDGLLRLAHLPHALELVELLPDREPDVLVRVLELQRLRLLGVVQAAEQDHLPRLPAPDLHRLVRVLELSLDAQALDGADDRREDGVAYGPLHLSERHPAQLRVAQHEHHGGDASQDRGLERAAAARSLVGPVACGHDVAPHVPVGWRHERRGVDGRARVLPLVLLENLPEPCVAQAVVEREVALHVPGGGLPVAVLRRVADRVQVALLPVDPRLL